MRDGRFSVLVMIRVILIAANCFVLIWFYTETSRPATTFFFFILVIFQTVSLIHYH